MKKILIALMMMGLSTGAMAEEVSNADLLKEIKQLKKEVAELKNNDQQVYQSSAYTPSKETKERMAKKNCKYWLDISTDIEGYFENIWNDDWYKKEKEQYEYLFKNTPGMTSAKMDKMIEEGILRMKATITAQVPKAKTKYQEKCV